MPLVPCHGGGIIRGCRHRALPERALHRREGGPGVGPISRRATATGARASASCRFCSDCALSTIRTQARPRRPGRLWQNTSTPCCRPKAPAFFPARSCSIRLRLFTRSASIGQTVAWSARPSFQTVSVSFPLWTPRSSAVRSSGWRSWRPRRGNQPRDRKEPKQPKKPVRVLDSVPWYTPYTGHYGGRRC